MNLSLGISPCPNDTFIFDALLHGKIDTEGLTFNYNLEDVQTLNQLAMQGIPDVCKVSYGAAGSLLDRYRILEAGGAMGKGVGPLFISKKYTLDQQVPENASVALPGINTTAHLLFSLAFPDLNNKIFLPFHEIEDAILEGKVDAGVIIHENRFTYLEKGLHKLADLGERWENQTGLPIPLGGILAKKDLGEDTLRKINRVIRRSLEYALKQHENLPPFVTENAQEMKPETMRQHIALYVNDFSLELGEDGRAAVCTLLETAQRLRSAAATTERPSFVG
jgi:1,4-dihydroxy-6-naphthoate synthase